MSERKYRQRGYQDEGPRDRGQSPLAPKRPVEPRAPGRQFQSASGPKTPNLMASHEVDALGDLFIDGVPLGALDGSGYATGSDWTTGTAEKLVTVTFSGSTTLTAAATAIVSAVSPGDNYNTYDQDRTVAISGGGLTLTVTDSLGDAPVTVVYKTSVSPAVIRVQKHLGSDSQTVDAYLTSVVPTEWDASHRLRGCAYLVVTLDLEDQRFQGGPPALTCRVRGKKLDRKSVV